MIVTLQVQHIREFAFLIAKTTACKKDTVEENAKRFDIEYKAYTRKEIKKIDASVRS